MNDKITILETMLLGATEQARVDVLNQLAWALRISNLTRMRQLANEAHTLAIQLDYAAGIAFSLAVLARANHYDGKNDLALKQVLDALALMDQHQIQGEARLSAMASLTNIYMIIDNYAEVLETGVVLLRMAEEAGNVEFQITALNMLGAAYSHTGNYQQALDHYALAFPLCQITQNRQMEGVLHLNQVIEYTELKDYPAALAAGMKALQILSEVNIPDLMVSALNKLGEIYAGMEDYVTALRYFHDAHTRAQTLAVNAQRLTAHAAFYLGKIYLAQQQFGEAESYLKQSLTIAEESQLRNFVFLSHEQLASNYEQQGDLKLALEHYRQFHRTKEAIFNTRNAEKINLLMILHQTEMLEKLRENDRHYFEQMNRMKDELIQTTSHDLKNPLSVMNTSLDLMRLKQPLDDREQRYYIERMQTQVERMKSLITSMLDLAALETQPANLQPIAIGDVLQQAVEEFELSMQQKQIALIFQPFSRDLYVSIDRQHIHQVLQNLLSNALKYTPENGNIVLGVRSDNGSIHILVQDTGIGIPERDQPRIFDKFYRVNDPVHAAIEGTGLGLSIVKKIIERYQGTIQVTSRPGAGSIFEVTLPVWKRSEKM